MVILNIWEEGVRFAFLALVLLNLYIHYEDLWVLGRDTVRHWRSKKRFNALLTVGLTIMVLLISTLTLLLVSLAWFVSVPLTGRKACKTYKKRKLQRSTQQQ